jgi:hypothetical protein
MEAEDRRVRAELLADGPLGDGYSPRMKGTPPIIITMKVGSTLGGWS